MIDVKLPGSYAPDVYISVMAVRGRVADWRVWLAEFAQRWKIPVLGRIANPTALVDLAKPSWRIGMTKVKVGWEAHRLNVAVRPDKERYQVRDQARTAIQVLGPNGKPAQSAEIAFAAVDQALAPALAQRKLETARRDDGRAAAVGDDLDGGDAGGRQAPLRPQGGSGRRRRGRRPHRPHPHRFQAGAAVEGTGRSRFQRPRDDRRAARRFPFRLQAGRHRDGRRRPVRDRQRDHPHRPGPHHLFGPAAPGPLGRRIWRDLHAPQRHRPAARRDRERRARRRSRPRCSADG